MIIKFIQFLKKLFSSEQKADITPLPDTEPEPEPEPEVTELVPDNAEIELEESQETTQISQDQIHEATEPKIEIVVSDSPEEISLEDALSRADDIVRLCAKSEALTDVDSKTYPKGDAEPKSLAHEIDRIRVGLE